MADNDEILRRLEALEKENDNLKRELVKTGKSKSGQPATTNIIVYESEYQGHPVLKFSIGRRFFAMGLRRLAATFAAKEIILDFVKRHDVKLLDWKAEHGGVMAEDKDVGDAEDVKI